MKTGLKNNTFLPHTSRPARPSPCGIFVFPHLLFPKFFPVIIHFGINPLGITVTGFDTRRCRVFTLCKTALLILTHCQHPTSWTGSSRAREFHPTPLLELLVTKVFSDESRAKTSHIVRHFTDSFGDSELNSYLCRRICDVNHCVMSHKVRMHYVYTRKR